MMAGRNAAVITSSFRRIFSAFFNTVLWHCVVVGYFANVPENHKQCCVSPFVVCAKSSKRILHCIRKVVWNLCFPGPILPLFYWSHVMRDTWMRDWRKHMAFLSGYSRVLRVSYSLAVLRITSVLLVQWSLVQPGLEGVITVCWENPCCTNFV
jgi:hypothetical protein